MRLFRKEVSRSPSVQVRTRSVLLISPLVSCASTHNTVSDASFLAFRASRHTVRSASGGRLIVAIRTVRDSAHIAMQQAQSAFKSCVESISSASQSVRTELQLFVAQMAESLHDDETSVPPFLARIAELFHQRTNAGTKGSTMHLSQSPINRSDISCLNASLLPFAFCIVLIL